MFVRPGDPGLRRLALIGVTLHLVFLMTAQFEHHDLLCHLKTPLHCTSCASSPLSPHPHAPAIVGACYLSDMGRAFAFLLESESVVLPVRSLGRSPPTNL